MKSFALHKYRSYLVWLENCKGRTLKEGNGSDNRKNIQLAKRKKNGKDGSDFGRKNFAFLKNS
jgi:hypothetical protein